MRENTLKIVLGRGINLGEKNYVFCYHIIV
jgi:hypothetical protein